MYCPNCGNKTSSDEKFCRKCGLGLEKIALSLGEQLPARVDDDLLARKERLEKWGVAALSVFGLGVLAIFIYALSQKLITSASLVTFLPLIGFFIMFGCGIGSVILFALARELGEKAGKRQLPANPPALPGSTRELLPEGRLEPVPTVTERTTELLFAEKRDNN